MHPIQLRTTKVLPLNTLSRALQTAFVGLWLGAGANAANVANVADLPAAPDATLPLVVVTAEKESATGAVQGYAARRSATGTKTDTPILETPQSITVIGAEQIETLKAYTVNDALLYSVGANAPDRTTDQIVLRGFTLFTSLRDGTNYQVNRFDGQQEVYGLERIEVLKGAASILYGMASPGGVLNTVSKRPSSEPLHELNVEVGSHARKQVSADFAGALSDDGVWSYRLTALRRDSGAFVDYIADNRSYLAPALKWQPAAGTSVTLLSEYQRDRSNYGGDAYPARGTLLPNSHGTVPRERFVGEPDYDHFRVKRYSAGYIVTHAFSEHLTLTHSLRRYKMDQDWASISGAGDFSADQRTVERFPEDRDEHTSRLTSDTALQYDWRAGAVAHKTLAGFDYSYAKRSSARYDRTVAPLDLYNPVYGSPVGPAVPSYGFSSKVKQLGLYVQDQMKFADKWVLLLGARHDRVTETECDIFNAFNCYTDHERSDATTGRAGVVYLAANGVAPFASFSQSFAPTSGIDRRGNRYQPTRGEQFETGVRYQAPGSGLTLSAAAYQLTQTNVLTSDPADIRYQLQQGAVRSRGIELEARGRVGRHGQIIGVYSYTDARTTKSGPLSPQAVGVRVSGVPYNQLSLWGDYSLGEVGLPGLKLGAGGRYVGEATSTFLDVKTPAYSVADLMASYSSGPWRLALNISNLSDKRYIATCPYVCTYGEPRRVTGSLAYRW